MLAFAALLTLTHSFTVAAPSELVATITVRCDTCAWDVEGREAVVLKLDLDGRPTISSPVAFPLVGVL